MVKHQLRARGLRDERVLEAMARVPREAFVPPEIAHEAYLDCALPIDCNQTISQPIIVAMMTEALHLTGAQKILEIGTGSGYQAAILAELAAAVCSVERHADLAHQADTRLKHLGYRNVFIRAGDGSLGWPEEAPFDRIIVTAAPDTIPQALVDQLAVGGIMVAPVGTLSQEIVIVTKTAGGVAEKRTIPVRFVPMVEKPK